MPEILKHGEDITIVSYGSVLRIIQEAAQRLDLLGISVEIIDVQTLLPFDSHHSILASLMEVQGGYRWLDATPRTLTGKAHRPAYGSDGDYFSKPNTEDVVRMVRAIMEE